jgi:polygalacturonase
MCLWRDFSILKRGHFALLAPGVDNLTIDNVKVDTNRDRFDIDSCRNAARITLWPRTINGIATGLRHTG